MRLTLWGIVGAALVGCGRDCEVRFADADGDGFGDPTQELRICGSDLTGTAANDRDCDDADSSVHPDAEERCNDRDDDCDSLSDDDDDSLQSDVRAWPDADGDGFGDAQVIGRSTCDPGEGVTQGGDCDDTDAAAFPGAAFAEDPSHCMVDGDGDGWGDSTPTAEGPLPGTDCDDADAQTYPGAYELFGSRDRNCDGQVNNRMVEDFGADGLDPHFLNFAFEPAQLGTHPVTGSRAARFEPGTWLSTRARSLADCETPRSRAQLLRVGDRADTRDQFQCVASPLGAAITTLDAGAIDEAVLHWEGPVPLVPGIDNPSTVHWALQDADGDEAVWVDELELICTGRDDDGDGVGHIEDCAPADPAHWSDCGPCLDDDGDGYGDDCDLGPDCDDTDATRSPGAVDLTFDGIDDDCDGEDGPGLYEDVEAGALDPARWPEVSGVTLVSDVPLDGAWSIRLVDTASLTSTAIDTTACMALEWSLQVGQELGGTSIEPLELSWFDGVDWVRLVDVPWHGDGRVDLVTGVLTDPLAFGPDFAVRIEHPQATPSRVFTIDDLAVGCGDGDPVPTRYDCAPFDPAHWDDCALCISADGDDYGEGCNLGSDCDDTDASVYPFAPDPLDGSDTDCNGADGPGFLDDFEHPGLPMALVERTGEWAINDEEVFGGAHALNLGGAGATLTSRTVDMGACDTVRITMEARRGPEKPDQGDDLLVEWWNGTAWREALRLLGEQRIDADFQHHDALITDPDAATKSFALRLTTTGGRATTVPQADGGPQWDDFFVDDLWLGCGPADADGDGVVEGVDCDDADADHWSDCGICVDADGDERGLGCDRGEDCDESDPAVYRGAPDTPGDGVDTSCDGEDGTVFFDDVAPATPDEWQNVDGLYRYAPTQTLGVGTLQSADTPFLDTSGCTDIVWSLRHLGSADTLGLQLRWFDGARWHAILPEPPDAVFAYSWSHWSGQLPPEAATPDFRLGLHDSTTARQLDDVYVGCALPDADADGVPDAADCDDDDDRHAFDCSTCVDKDDDGTGVGCDAGSDCDDADPTSTGCRPGTTADWYDDFDQGLVDDTFWDDAPEPAADPRAANGWIVQGSATTLEVDTSACADVTWFVRTARGDWAGRGRATTTATLSWSDGTSDTQVLQIDGEGRLDPIAATWWGTVTDPAALTPTFHLSWEGTSQHPLDAVGFGCTGPDTDGDGVPSGVDCDDDDDRHATDCLACVDADDDGYGLYCDLGSDCDDDDDQRHPGLTDPAGDGSDTDCSGVDGPGLVDDFELGVLQSNRWPDLPSDASLWGAPGSYALRFTTSVQTAPIDTSSCTTVAFGYRVRTFGQLSVSSFDGADWVVQQVHRGSTNFAFRSEQGLITGPEARATNLSLRFEALGAEVVLDDVEIRCGSGDIDGDGIDGAFDCDDADALHWADCGVCSDTDGDGYGIDCDLGADCAPFDATVHPGAPDPYGDGVDADCDGVDGPSVSDDFDSGEVSTTAWAEHDLFVFWNDFMDEDVEATFEHGTAYGRTAPIDASTCPAVSVQLALRSFEWSPPAIGSDVEVRFFDGSDWTLARTLPGDGLHRGVQRHAIVIDDPAALHASTQIEITSRDQPYAYRYLDDVWVGCTDVDADADGFAPPFDCDDTDPGHWGDCGLCVDADGDGYGADCDLGDDCDDADAAMHPGAPDPFGDDLDDDCSNADGPSLADDFDEVVASRQVWAAAQGVRNPFVTADALTFSGTGDFIETVPVDTSLCPAVLWALSLDADGGDTLDVFWDDGLTWVPSESFTLDGTTVFGLVDDPAALHPDFALRLESTIVHLWVTIDDFELLCVDVDVDGDGLPPQLDCDDADADHWGDCGLCIDADGDGFGDRCDLGDDCDDADDTIYPGAIDALGDGLDADCSGLDGEGELEGFEDPGSAAAWLVGDAAITDAFASGGLYALQLSGDWGEATLPATDTTGCTAVDWALQLMRGPEAPDPADSLTLAYDDGIDWIDTATFAGDGTDDPDFVLHTGTITDPAAMHADFRLRLTSDGADQLDDFYVDQINWVCR
ncbi:MAG: putative metal-binding motif-containing protein [Myxococcales bacterium]|nr:putative metal-binding motif-containing protein [Myxococcales bacterium]